MTNLPQLQFHAGLGYVLSESDTFAAHIDDLNYEQALYLARAFGGSPTLAGAKDHIIGREEHYRKGLAAFAPKEMPEVKHLGNYAGFDAYQVNGERLVLDWSTSAEFAEDDVYDSLYELSWIGKRADVVALSTVSDRSYWFLKDPRIEARDNTLFLHRVDTLPENIWIS